MPLLDALRVAVVAPIGSCLLELEVELLKRERVQLVRFDRASGLLALLGSGGSAPHLIFLEHGAVDALALLAELRRLAKAELVPVVILASGWGPAALARASASGANSSLSWPAEPAERTAFWHVLSAYWCDTNELPV